MKKTTSSLGALALLASAGVVWGGTVYTDRASWEAALAGQTIQHLSLQPQVLPTGGVLVTSSELWLRFDAADEKPNEITATGWKGDVHNPMYSGPHLTQATFARPLVAFGADIGVGSDVGPPYDRITLTLDSSATLTPTDYPITAPAFWGWIGEPTRILDITTDGVRHFYTVSNVEYVNMDTSAVPLPPAVFAVAPLLAGMLLHRFRRSAKEHEPV